MTIFNPREKLEQYGAESLDSAELLAIILRHGNRKEGIQSMVERIMGDVGLYAIKFPGSVKECSEQLGLGRVQSCQVLATIELGKRLFDQQRVRLKSVEDVAEYVDSMKSLKKEVFRGLYVSTALEVLADETISMGSLDKNIVHPREVFSPALSNSAFGIILVHNHPSGRPEPSDEDISMTIQLSKIAKILQIRLIDHIIIAREGSFSFKEADLIE